MGLVGRHTELLRRAPSFRWLFLATLGSGLGSALAVIALAVDVFDRTDSNQWVAALLLAGFLPTLVIGLLLGPLVDRLPRRSTMVASDLLRFVAFVLLPFAPNAGMVVVLAAVAGFATAFFRPAVYAALPNLVAEDDLPHANALFQAVENLTWLIGPVLGGLLVATAGPDLAYWLNAVTFVVSAALIVRIPRPLLQRTRSLSKGHLKDLAEGFGVVRRSRSLVTVMVAWTIVMVGNAHVNVAEVALAKVSFGAGDFGFGLLAGAAGLGLVLGSIAAGAWIESRPIGFVYGGSILLMGVGIGAAAVSPTIWVAAVCVVVSGFGNGVAAVCNPMFVQRGAPDRLRGRAFTVVMSVNYAVLGLAMALAGPVTDAFGARWAWGASAAVYVVAAGAAYVLARGIGELRQVEEEDLLPARPAPVRRAARQVAGVGDRAR